MTYYIEE